MSDIGIQNVLSQMRALEARVAGAASETGAAGGTGTATGTGAANAPDTVEFSAALKQSLDAVNAMQQESATLATAFERGDPDVSLARVMVASEKAGVAFEAVTQVRNRLLSAYRDIMNMPI